MHLFIDESGSFRAGSPADSWCVVGCLSTTERARAELYSALATLKRKNGRPFQSEIKLKDVSETSYFQYLDHLSTLPLLLIACAVNGRLMDNDLVLAHHRMQTAGVRENIHRVVDPAARANHEAAADAFSKLSPPLYLQLCAQYEMLAFALSQAILFFVQRQPPTLSTFRWRVDQKQKQNSIFDRVFRELAAPILQSKSMLEPQPMIVGADYSHFRRFVDPDGPPRYLKEAYGFDFKNGYNIGKVMREDFKFVDSSSHHGVQCIDLLVSGLRRCLRGGFSDNSDAAARLGRLMTQAQNGQPPLQLLTLSASESVPANSTAYNAIRAMAKSAKPMIYAKIMDAS